MGDALPALLLLAAAMLDPLRPIRICFAAQHMVGSFFFRAAMRYRAALSLPQNSS